MIASCRRLFASSSILQRAILLSVCVGYASSFFGNVSAAFVASPYSLFHDGRAWTLLTFWAMENGLAGVACDVCLVHLAHRIIEPCWGERCACYFFVAVNSAVAVISCLLLYAMYALHPLHEWMFHTTPPYMGVRGLSGFGGAVLYVLARTFPQNPVHAVGKFRIKIVHLPALGASLYLLLTLLTYCVRGAAHRISEHYFIMYVSGLFCAWVYFACYEKKRSTFANTHLNLSLSWFDSMLRSNSEPVIMDDLSCVKVVDQPKAFKETVSAADAERYRQKAIKDLNARLANARAASTPVASSRGENEATTRGESSKPSEI